MNIVNLFNFIEDENDSVHRLLLNYLGRERNTEAEKLLSAYIEKNEFKQAEKMHMLECFQALGRCGSDRSIFLLQRILMNPGWMPTSRRSANRQGAAAALAAIGSHEALSVLKEAAKSRNPGIRSAVKKAFKSIGDFR
jgi:HEAT repeat protein